MPHIDELKELISLTKLFLLSEYSPKEWKFCDEASYRFFKERAQKLPLPEKAPAPAPKIEAAQEPPKIAIPPKEAPKAITPPKEAPKKEEAAVINLEPVRQTDASDFSDIKKILQARFPALTLLPAPPDDSEAKKESKAAFGEIVILSFERQTSPFIKNLACAIQQEIAPCTIVSAARLESEKEWENLLRQEQLKLILSTDYGLFSLPGAMPYFREIPKQAKSFLGNVPLLLLTDLSLYLKEPKLKPTLWRAICQMLSSGMKRS